MIDGDVQRVIVDVLETGLTDNSISAIVSQSFQPTSQGATLATQVVFTKITTRRFGWQGRKYVLVPGNPPTYTLQEPYYLRPTYQVSCLTNQDPSDSAGLNAYDVLDICAAFLQSVPGLATFKAAEIGIDRVTDIRTPAMIDDRDQSISDANFDFVLSYKNTLTSTVPAAESATGIFERV